MKRSRASIIDIALAALIACVAAFVVWWVLESLG